MNTLTLTTSQEPTILTNTSNRLEIVDALRGFTLLGIILLHSMHAYSSHALELSNLDELLSTKIEDFISKKFYSIFSFLFGWSFAIQIKSALKKGQSFTHQMICRLVVLFAIGYVHYLIFPGDVIRSYAVLGLLLILCHKWSDKQLLIFSFILFTLNIFTNYYLEVYKGHESLERLMESVGHIIPLPRLFTISSLFVLGLFVGRKNIFIDTPENRALFNKLLIISTTGVVIMFAAKKMMPKSDTSLFTVASTYLRYTFLSLFYFSLIVVLNRIQLFQKALQTIVPIGKISLTAYITQSIFIAIVFNYLLASVEGIGLLTVLSISLIFYTVQLIFARYWLSKFKFGPLEWLLRTLTSRLSSATKASSIKPA
jgi:uncharacterized protein